MKFGSRMDVFVPPECDLLVRQGQRVVAGETVIARWTRPARVGGVSTPAAPGRRRILGRWRLVSPTGAKVVSLRQLPKRERARLLAPSAFTTLNMMSGLSSVLLAFRDHFTLAAALIAVSIVLDIADGFVARLIGATSPFGLQLDSLADLISFGLAPAVLIHTWALDEWPVLAWLAAFLWLSCAAFRLARFNVTIDPTADKRYFVGLPSPGAAAVVMATILALDSPHWGPVHRPVARLVPARRLGRPGPPHGHDGPVPLLPQPPGPADLPGPGRDGGRRGRHRRRPGRGARPHGPPRRLRLRPHRPARRADRPRCASAFSGPPRSRRRAPGCRRSSSPSRRTPRRTTSSRTRRTARRRSPRGPRRRRPPPPSERPRWVRSVRLGEPSFDVRAAIT